MAILDLSSAFRAFSMTDPNLVTFNRAYQADPSAWLFNTPDGHALRLAGHGLSYDAQGRAKTGLVNSIEIDLGNDNPLRPEIKITGISASAPRLDDGPTQFWHILEGNDVIHGPQTSKGASTEAFTLAGDGIVARSGAFGGRDIIHTGDGEVVAYGDVQDVGSATPEAPPVTYRGGDDQILGLETTRRQTLTGDVGSVHAGSKLTGGHDTIFVQTIDGSTVVGDAFYVGTVGAAGGAPGELVGGNDNISGGPNFRGTLVGDALVQRAGSLVRGGADTIMGGDLAETIAGDVFSVDGTRLIGGNDALAGNGGNDTIYGDGYAVGRMSSVVGGDDVLRGGRGNDKLRGDFGGVGIGDGGDDRLYGDDGDDELDGDSGDDILNGGSGKDILIGDDGDDQLYGGAANDTLDGNQGNDLMDGGAGGDALHGGAGHDTYYVNDQLDRVIEGTNAGHDTVWSFLSAYRLRGEVEDLRFNGLGSFTGIGNDLANTIQGSAAADDLRGEGGDDILIGGGGGDLLQGGAGNDTASYVGNGVGINVRMTGGYGGDATGDTYSGIENFIGSDFADSLYGDEGANRLSGGAGDDYLQGHYGNDTLVGGGGRDNLVGGYTGNDTFVFNARGEGRDRIADFSSGAGNDDRFLFDGDAFGGLAAGALSASRFVANTSGAATSSSHRFVYETDTGILRFDANGSAAGGATEIALLTSTPNLAFDDFFIV